MTNTWTEEKHVFITNWSEQLKLFSIPSVEIPLLEDHFNLIQELFFVEKPTSNHFERMKPLINEIADAIRQLGPIFLRNDRRSPKDSEVLFNGLCPANSAMHALVIFLNSERMWEDFKLSKENGHIPTLVARKWMPFSKEREFRCFVREGKLLGASQYYHRERYDWIVDNILNISFRIKDFFEQIKPFLPAEDIVFDIHIGDRETILIETNPYGMSDPCLFQYYPVIEECLEKNDYQVRFRHENPKKEEPLDIFAELENM